MTILYFNGNVNGDKEVALPLTKRQTALFSTMAEVFSKPEMKEHIVQMVVENILKSIDLVRVPLYKDKFYKDIRKSTKVFEWKMADHKERMKPTAKAMDILRLEDRRTLSIAKLLADLANVEDIVMDIYENKVNWAKVTLIGCRRVLDERDNLKIQHSYYTKLLSHYCIQIVGVMPNLRRKKMAEMQQRLQRTIDSCMDDQLVYNPILLRYIRNYQLTNLEGLEHKLMIKEKAISNKSDSLNDTVDSNEYVFKNTMQYFTYQIETLRNNINYWSWRYETDFEKIDNEVSHCELVLRALQKDVTDHHERLQFYRDEMARFYEEKRKADELRAQSILEAMRIEAEKAAQKDKKRKSKTKDKKGSRPSKK